MQSSERFLGKKKKENNYNVPGDTLQGIHNILSSNSNIVKAMYLLISFFIYPGVCICQNI